MCKTARSSIRLYAAGAVDCESLETTLPENSRNSGRQAGCQGDSCGCEPDAYVSSAGLRALLMMYKSLDNQDGFGLTGVSDEVREILETTGFDQFLLMG